MANSKSRAESADTDAEKKEFRATGVADEHVQQPLQYFLSETIKKARVQRAFLSLVIPTTILLQILVNSGFELSEGESSDDEFAIHFAVSRELANDE